MAETYDQLRGSSAVEPQHTGIMPGQGHPPPVRLIPQVELGERSEKIGALMAALARVQKKLQPAQRNAYNPGTKKHYADFESIIAAAQAAGLGEEGLAVSQGFEQDPERPDLLRCVTTLALGSADQWITNQVTIRIGGKGGFTSPAQDVVAASTYARRIGYQSITGVVAAGEDEDGNERGAGERGRPRPPAPDRGARPGPRQVAPAKSPAATPREPKPELVTVLDAELHRQERIVHLMRELQPRGFKISKKMPAGTITFHFPKDFLFEGRSFVRFDELSLGQTEALETKLRDQLAARPAGGSNPASAAPSQTPGDRPTRSGREGPAATEGSRGPRGEPPTPGDDDVPF